MKTISISAIAAAIIISIGLTASVDAKPKKPNANVSVKVTGVKAMSKKATPKSHTSRKQMYNSAKAALKRGKGTLKTARGNLKAAKKSEARNRALRTQAKSRFDQARYAYQANPNPQTKAAANQALNAYLPVRQQHLNAASALQSSSARVNQLMGFQRSAMATMKATKQLKPKTTAAPKITRAAQFVRPKSAYDVVPGPQNIYSSVGLPVQRLNSGVGANQRYTPGPLRQNAYDAPRAAMQF